MLLLIFVGAVILSSAQATLVGDPCTNHTSCNYDGSSPIAQTYCENNTCQCTSLYYGTPGDSLCRQAELGDACTEDAFCMTACGRSLCVNGTCLCRSGTYRASGTLGRIICPTIQIGTPCDPANGGTTFCQAGITNAECHLNKMTCSCADGETYVSETQLCVPQSFQPECSVCGDSGGLCYDMEGDNSPTGCTCPSNSDTSATDLASTLTVGCDLGLAEIGDYCDESGYPVKCVQPHSSCVHNGKLNGIYKCACEPGYFPVISKYESAISICYRSLSKETDPNCEWCLERGGQCYDIDDDSIRDGCMCPSSRSTDPDEKYNPRSDCAVPHVTVKCEALEMIVCYNPHNTRAYPNITNKLDSQDAYVYLRNYFGQDPCIFEKNADNDNWCLTLSLQHNETDACGTASGYPEANVIDYQNWMAVQLGSTMGADDLFFHLYCEFNTIIHTVTMSGASVVGFASVASEGKTIHPKMVLNAFDEFWADASQQAVHLGQFIGLEVVMVDNKDIYTHIRTEVCIASSRPELADPRSETYLLLYNGCPYDRSPMTLKTMFHPDPADSMKSRTGLFPMFQFDNSDFVFFHCAVQVCMSQSECAPRTCPAKRKRRSGDMFAVGEETIVRTRRVAGGRGVLENLQSPPILLRHDKAHGFDRVDTVDKENRQVNGKKTRVEIGGLAKQLPILIAVVAGGTCILIIISSVLIYKFKLRYVENKTDNF